MSGPGVIRLKRKRDQQPPDTLIVEPQRKRVQGVDGEFRGHYIRRQESVSDGQAIDPSSAASNPPSASNGSASFNGFPKRRLFQIRPLPHDSRSGRARGGSVATIVETRTPQKRYPTQGASGQNNLSTPTQSPLKRPGRGAITPRPETTNTPGTGNIKDESQLQAIANSLSKFADDELSKTAKPKLLSTPKLSGTRSREIHQQRAASASISHNSGSARNDIDMAHLDDEHDHDYVYDTYILSSQPSFPSTSSSMLPSNPSHESTPAGGNIGYIVITDDDAALWDEFLLEESSTNGLNSKTLDAGGDEDDEDENAEDWYGAEYPDEEEVASDDGSDEGGFGGGLRNRGNADDEEWDVRSDVQEWSDGEDGERRGPGGGGGLGKGDFLKMSTEEFLRRLGEADDGH